MKKLRPRMTSGADAAELDDLSAQIKYWWFTNANPVMALDYARKFERRLKRLGADDGSITLQQHWGLLHQVKGRLDSAIACREREIALIERLFDIGGPVGTIDYTHFATRLQGLIDMYIGKGETAQAARARRKLLRFVRAHCDERELAREQAKQMELDIVTGELEIARRCEGVCDPLIARGLKLHESGRTAAAMQYFERVLHASPHCPFAVYDRANALHSLGRDDEAEQPLRDLICATPDELSQQCAAKSFRNVQIDAHFLLFHVLLYGRGFCGEAFALAEKHLSLRRRGVRSAWTMQEVQANIAAMRRAWEAGVKLTGPAPPVSDIAAVEKLIRRKKQAN